jgi:hypothetical protein
MNARAFILLLAFAAAGCGEKVAVENDSARPPVNTASPNPIVKSPESVTVPVTNLPNTKSTNR